MCTAIENRNWLFFELEDKESKVALWIENIYGPTTQASKDAFWNALEDQSSGKKHLLCIIFGDFNVTISAEERRGGSKV